MKKVLIIAEWIAPTQYIASVRWSKIAYFLKKDHDLEITVLTNKKNYSDLNSPLPICKKDELLNKSLQAFDRYYEFDYGKIYYFFASLYYKIFGKKEDKVTSKLDDSPSENRSKRNGIRLILSEISPNLHFFIRKTKDYYIAKECKSFIRKHDEEYDFIISTYAPLWSHLAASYLKGRNNCKWLADFRDCYVTSIDGQLSLALNKGKVRKVCKNADYILRVNDDLELYLGEDKRMVTICNGFDPEEALLPIPPTKFSLVFTGVLFNSRRDFSAVFKALQELIFENRIKQEDVEINVAGPDNSEMLIQAKKYGMEQNVVCHGIIARKDALKLQQKAAVLLQGNWNLKGDKTGWSGKMYEYMMSQKPIIFTVTGDVPYSFPSFHMGKLGGICYEYIRHDEMFEPLKEYIWSKYSEWIETGDVSIQNDNEYVKQYSYDNIANQVWSLLE